MSFSSSCSSSRRSDRKLPIRDPSPPRLSLFRSPESREGESDEEEGLSPTVLVSAEEEEKEGPVVRGGAEMGSMTSASRGGMTSGEVEGEVTSSSSFSSPAVCSLLPLKFLPNLPPKAGRGNLPVFFFFDFTSPPRPSPPSPLPPMPSPPSGPPYPGPPYPGPPKPSPASATSVLFFLPVKPKRPKLPRRRVALFLASPPKPLPPRPSPPTPVPPPGPPYPGPPYPGPP
mmetsp:Transcript_25362/g.49545  ORF Transcript_25362/g.49545 Transcript_25362/m.49545 type:complete len:229 (-) Transcript_25362:720-1406(-)